MIDKFLKMINKNLVFLENKINFIMENLPCKDPDSKYKTLKEEWDTRKNEEKLFDKNSK